MTLCDPMDYSPPGSFVNGILQARTLEWVAMPSSRGSSWPRDWTHVSYISRIGKGFFTTRATCKPGTLTLMKLMNPGEVLGCNLARGCDFSFHYRFLSFWFSLHQQMKKRSSNWWVCSATGILSWTPCVDLVALVYQLCVEIWPTGCPGGAPMGHPGCSFPEPQWSPFPIQVTGLCSLSVHQLELLHEDITRPAVPLKLLDPYAPFERQQLTCRYIVVYTERMIHGREIVL